MGWSGLQIGKLRTRKAGPHKRAHTQPPYTRRDTHKHKRLSDEGLLISPCSEASSKGVKKRGEEGKKKAFQNQENHENQENK
eukprot:NODE_5343_length_515_cov_29.830472_g3965_i0.p1 GENE.NODE_5343_length_515_cov_29.830472_g3965_i0~~NODE_5343_length_515_cov_29.830472_g3965_i0.p1  ORF type:complete len:82 (+),score=7.33 NODE_5343_length_515_cov_29.830472_g3965_i0:154-399(+)